MGVLPVPEWDNKKQGAARNAGLKIAKGKYILFLDSDDYIRHDTCSLLFDKAEELNLDMLSFSGTNFLDETGEIKENPYYMFRYLPSNWDKKIFSYKDCTTFITSMAVSTALTFYNRDFIISNNIKFPENIYFEDNLFFAKSILSAKRISIEKECLYFRRIHSTSTTQNWEKYFADYLKASSMIIDYIGQKNIDIKIYNNYIRYYTESCTNLINSFSNDGKILHKKSYDDFIFKYTNKYIKEQKISIFEKIKSYFHNTKTTIDKLKIYIYKKLYTFNYKNRIKIYINNSKLDLKGRL